MMKNTLEIYMTRVAITRPDFYERLYRLGLNAERAGRATVEPAGMLGEKIIIRFEAGDDDTAQSMCDFYIEQGVHKTCFKVR